MKTDATRNLDDNAAIFGLLSLFAILLAFITWRHEMYIDEVQPWLFVRDATSVIPVIQHLRYEAHPALWFVLLYAASRITSSVVAMQCVNFLLAVSMAWLILSARSLPLLLRILIVFGASVFFTTGVIARDYMLGGLLLVGAARALLAKKRRHWLAMILLALAINSHFLAIPVAASVFLWLYWLEPNIDVKTLKIRLTESRFWLSIALLAAALVACFFTVRPAGDIATHLEIPGANLFDYLVLGVGRIWHYYLPVTLSTDASVQSSKLAWQAFSDVTMTFLLFTMALSVLPGKRSRCFLFSACAFWTACVVTTFHVPLATHSSFVAVSFIIALLINRRDDKTGSWLPLYAREPVLVVLLSVQVLICLQFCIKEWSGPFSAGKSVADWLKAAGLVDHPLVVQSELAAPTVMAYAGIRKAYFPSCQCSRPFVLYIRGWDSTRSVTREELRSLEASTGKSPVVLSVWPISQSDQTQLGLRLAYISPKGWGFNNEDVFVYRGTNPREQP